MLLNASSQEFIPCENNFSGFTRCRFVKHSRKIPTAESGSSQVTLKDIFQKSCFPVNQRPQLYKNCEYEKVCHFASSVFAQKVLPYAGPDLRNFRLGSAKAPLVRR